MARSGIYAVAPLAGWGLKIPKPYYAPSGYVLVLFMFSYVYDFL
jgi:hypothetical protein